VCPVSLAKRLGLWSDSPLKRAMSMGLVLGLVSMEDGDVADRLTAIGSPDGKRRMVARAIKVFAEAKR